MKRALQPAVTDVEVDFQLTSGFDVFQAPAKIPTIFKGDKTVVYGIFKSKAASDAPLEAGLTGTATLKGQISDMPISHSISFEIPVPTPSIGEKQGNVSDMPIVHHLAAKSLLSDWSNGLGWSSTALTDERKQEMVNLSIESSVISEHTAFIAYDVDQSKAIKGAVQVWDVTASMTQQTQIQFGYQQAQQSYGVMSLCAAAPAPMMQRGLISGGGGPPPSRSMMRSCPPPLQMMESGPPPPLMMKGGPPPPAPMMKCGAPPPPPGASRSMASAAPKTRKAKKSAKSMAETSRGPPSGEADALTILISLQQAAGFWSLNAVTDKIIKKKEAVDPPQGAATDIWATVLALVFLEIRCAEQNDEWELIAMKAEAWLSGQTLTGISLASLKERAKSIITG